MKVFQEITVDETNEKHIPIIETIAGGLRVNVGNLQGVAHGHGICRQCGGLGAGLLDEIFR